VIHGLPRRIFSTDHGRRAFAMAAVVYMLGHLFFAIAPLLPNPPIDNFPWGMFKTAAGDHVTVIAWGFDDEGKRVDIDLSRWFHYTRGTTELRVYDHHPALQQNQAHHRQEQRALARWLAQRVYVEDGVKLTKVKLQRRRQGLRTGRVKIEDIRTVPIREADYTAALPEEARVNTP
jgi:hypothetical protein